LFNTIDETTQSNTNTDTNNNGAVIGNANIFSPNCVDHDANQIYENIFDRSACRQDRPKKTISLKEKAIDLNNSGVDAYKIGKYQEAIDYYQRSLFLLKTIGDRTLKATILNNLGNVHNALGEKQKALEYYNQAFPLFQALGDRIREIHILNKIASLCYQTGDKPKSLDYFNQVLALVKVEKDSTAEGITLNNIGEIYRSLEDETKAREYYQQALIVFQESNPELATTVQENIAQLSENTNIANNSSPENITFYCRNINGVPTTFASLSSNDIAFIKWQNDSLTTSGYTPQQRCEDVTAKLQESYQQGFKYMTTGLMNRQNVVCMTSTEGGSCETLLFALKANSNPNQTLQALLNIRSSASGPLSETNSRVYINLVEYFKKSF
jgi:tetratricopeptide (TPR) repeat protein